MKICYVGGCGHLGMSLAAWSAHRGFDVVCADINKDAVDTVNKGLSPISEPQVADLIKLHAGQNLVATADVLEAACQSDMIFVIVDTPSKDDGAFSLHQVLSACKEIGLGLATDTRYRVVVMVSTINPGDSQGYIIPALAMWSGREPGTGFGYAYAPEFIRQGSIVRDFANPDMIVIGELDERSGAMAEAYYSRITYTQAPSHRMSITSAEIAKLGLNVAVVAKMGVANTLAMLCHNTPGADARDVLQAIGEDTRIGHKYFGAGTAPGGPCFPRDTRALATAALHAGTPANLALALDSLPREQADFIANAIWDTEPWIVGILGLTYKPDVDLLVGSQGYMLSEALRDGARPTDSNSDLYHVDVRTYDPMVEGDDLESVVGASDFLVLMTCWFEFKALENMDLNGKVILDMWGFLDENKLNCSRYIRFGRGPDASDS